MKIKLLFYMLKNYFMSKLIENFKGGYKMSKINN